MGPATRVMSLRDGTKKMSKSDPSDMSRINMTDDADTIAKKIQQGQDRPAAAARATRPSWRSAPRPTISSASTPRSPARRKAEVLAEFGGAQFSTFKKALAELAVVTHRPGQRRDERACSPTPPRSTASSPTARARPARSPRPIVDKVKDIVGFLRS